MFFDSCGENSNSDNSLAPLMFCDQHYKTFCVSQGTWHVRQHLWCFNLVRRPKKCVLFTLWSQISRKNKQCKVKDMFKVNWIVHVLVFDLWNKDWSGHCFELVCLARISFNWNFFHFLLKFQQYMKTCICHVKCFHLLILFLNDSCQVFIVTVQFFN